MNKLSICLFFSASLILTTATLFAQDQASPVTAEPATTEVLEAQDQEGTVKETVTETAPAAPAAESAEPAKTKEGKAIVTHDLKGQIQSIDPEARTFTVEGKQFTFWKSGKVFFKRKKKSLADLKVGDLVAVTYRVEKDGSLSASRINK